MDQSGNARWALLVAGSAHSSIVGTETRPWKDLTGDLYSLLTVGQVYADLVPLLGRENIIVMGLFQETLEFFRVASQTGVPAWGSMGIGTEETKYQFKLRLEELETRCRKLFEDGGADYDGIDVNPTTLAKILSGEPTREGGKVIPLGGAQSIFIAIVSHGSSQKTTLNPTGICDICKEAHDASMTYTHAHSSINTREWYFHLPYPATELASYSWVHTDNCCIEPQCNRPLAKGHERHPLCCFYWQHLFAALHKILTVNPTTKIISLFQFCTSGGVSKFLKNPAFQQYHQTNRWPVMLITTAGEQQGSLNEFITHFMQSFRTCMTTRSKTTIKELFERAERSYWKENSVVREMNACAEEPDTKFGDIDCVFGTNSGIDAVLVRDIFVNPPKL